MNVRATWKHVPHVAQGVSSQENLHCLMNMSVSLNLHAFNGNDGVSKCAKNNIETKTIYEETNIKNHSDQGSTKRPENLFNFYSWIYNNYGCQCCYKKIPLTITSWNMVALVLSAVARRLTQKTISWKSTFYFTSTSSKTYWTG